MGGGRLGDMTLPVMITTINWFVDRNLVAVRMENALNANAKMLMLIYWSNLLIKVS